MKKLFGLLLLIPAIGLCDTKISALPSTSTLNSVDIIPVVTNPGTSPQNFSITKANLISTLGINGGTPGGSNTQVQYNNSGAFGADANFTWDKTGHVLTASGQMNSGLSFGINGSTFVWAGQSSANANIFAGLSSGSNASSIFGNTCIGNDSCKGLTSSTNFNSCYGEESCTVLSGGSDNSCFGVNACTLLTTGSNNAVYGTTSGNVMTTGGSNTCFGNDACDRITTGNSNTVLGNTAGPDIVSGARNTCLGGDSNAFQSCQGIVAGSSNTMVGAGSGGNLFNLLTGNESGNVFVSYQGGMSSGVNYGIGIGYQPQVLSSNTAVIGGALGAFNEENLVVSSITTNYVRSKYSISAGSMTGAGLTSCSGTSNAVTWNSGTNQFGCNTIAGGSGGGSLAVGTGTTSGYSGVITSSPTPVVLFDNSIFGSSLQGGGTNFITIPSNAVLSIGKLGVNKSGAFSGGVDGTGVFNSDTGMQAPWFTNTNTLSPALAINSSGANFGLIENSATGVWNLGFGTSKTSLGTSVLKWDSSQNISASSWNSSSSSVTVIGPLGLGVTYGVTAGSATIGSGGISLSSSTAVFNTFIDSNTSTAQTIDWTKSNLHYSRLTGNVTYTFTAPAKSATLKLIIDSGAGTFGATWPASVKWAGGSAPTLTATANVNDIVVCTYLDFKGVYDCDIDKNFPQ